MCILKKKRSNTFKHISKHSTKSAPVKCIENINNFILICPLLNFLFSTGGEPFLFLISWYFFVVFSFFLSLPKSIFGDFYMFYIKSTIDTSWFLTLSCHCNINRSLMIYQTGTKFSNVHVQFCKSNNKLFPV